MIRTENEYILYSDYAELVITRRDGRKIYSQIDLDKIDIVKQKHWVYTNTGYIRATKNEGCILLHRFLKNANKEDVIDHIDGDTLNNRLSNLRFCTLRQNARNSRNRPKPNGVIGVRKDKRCKSSYRSQIYLSSNICIAKTFTDDELAILRSIPKDLEYLARDKNGELCLYSDKPEKCSEYWCGFITEINIRIFNHLFKSICWEDEEPIRIDDYVDRQ